MNINTKELTITTTDLIGRTLTITGTPEALNGLATDYLDIEKYNREQGYASIARSAHETFDTIYTALEAAGYYDNL